MTLDGAFSQGGLGTVATAGDITTTNDNISFAKAVVLTGNVAFDTGAGLGDIQFASTVDGAYIFSLAAGTGSVAFDAPIGSTIPLTFLGLTSSGTVRLDGIGTNALDGVAGTVAVTSSGAITLLGADYRSGGDQTWLATTQGVHARMSANAVWNANGTLGSISLPGTDLYLDAPGATLTLLSNLTVRNFVGYRGTLNVNARTLATTADFAAFGPAYNPSDVDWIATNNRFAYFPASGFAWYPAPYPSDGTYVAATGVFSTAPAMGFADLQAATISVAGNFYVNGSDLPATAPWTLLNSPTAAGHPVFNATAAATAGQWGGSAYSVILNSVVDWCNAAYPVNAAKAFAGEHNNGASGANNNANVVFHRPELKHAETVYDDVIRVYFQDETGADLAIENSNDEIAAAVAAYGASVAPTGGGVWFNNSGSPVRLLGVFADPACTIPTTGQGNLSSFFLRIGQFATDPTAPSRWNTDATGTSAGRATSTDRGRSSSSPVGYEAPAHRGTIPDLAFLKGLFYSAVGKAMVRSYGNASFGGSPFAAYTATVDRTRPVVIALRTGQETHNPPTGGATQEPYDAHNFFEIDWSEPVTIGDLDHFSLGSLVPDYAPVGGSAPAGQLWNVRSNAAGAPGTSAPFGASNHGGDYSALAGTATLHGFFTLPGSITSGTRDAAAAPLAGTGIANSLYRDPALPQRLRVYIAGWSSGATLFWPGWIKDPSQPAGQNVTVLENLAVKDGSVATDKDGLVVGGGPIEPSGPSWVIADAATLSYYYQASTGSTAGSATSSSGGDPATVVADATEQAGKSYGAWDIFAPVLAEIRNKNDWTKTTAYEVVPVDIKGNTRYSRMEFHVLDNKSLLKADGSALLSGGPSSGTDKGDMVSRWASINGWILDDLAPGVLGQYLTFPNARKLPDSRGGARPIQETTAGSVAVNNQTLGGIRDTSLTTALALGKFSFHDSSKSTDTASAAHNAGFVSYVLSPFFDTSGVSVNVGDDPYFGLVLDDTPVNYPWTTTSSMVVSYDETGYVTDLAGNVLQGFTDLPAVDKTPPRFRITLAIADSSARKVYIQFNKPILMPDLDAAIADPLVGVGGIFAFSDPAIKVTAIDKVQSGSKPSSTELMLTVNQNLKASDILSLRVNPSPFDVNDPITGLLVGGSHILDDFGNPQLPTESHRVSDLGLNVVKMIAATDGVHEVPSQANPESGDTPTSGLGALRVFDGTGRLLLRDITLYSALSPSVGAATGLPIQLYYDMTSDQGLAPFVNITGRSASLGLYWLPGILPGFNLKANTAARSLSPFQIGTGASLLRNFRLPVNDAGMKSGAEVGFLFSYGGLFAARATDPDDPRQFDLFRFSVQDVLRQRGSVTILSNVINPTKGERTAIEVILPTAGSLTVTVFTLDGDIVKYLYNDRQAAGTYTYFWDGRNLSGDATAQGIYFVRVVGPNMDEIRKVLVVK
jgi:hypothetical protein